MRIIVWMLLLVSVPAVAQYSWFYTQCEDTCRHVHGLDLSHYQGEVFWEQVGENKHNTYVYLKATEGGDRVDDRYAHNISMARKHGLYVGSYHFYRPRTPQMVQLKNFTTQCRAKDQDLIPMIDIETCGGLSFDAFIDSLSLFLRLVEDYYHVKPLIYAGANFYDKYLAWGFLRDYKIMIAQYTDYEPTLIDERSITLWQYTSSGSVHGVNGCVDKSRFVGDHRLREIRYIRRHSKEDEDFEEVIFH